jgi:hypothetical protein
VRKTLTSLVLLAAIVSQTAPQAGIASPGANAAQPVCQGAEGYSAAFGGRRTFFFVPDVLERLKTRRERDPAVTAAYKALVAKAEAAMRNPLYTVVDKRTIPPSGDRHDYLSVGPYWWPDPSKPDGMPFIRRDGEINPDRSSDKYDLADLDSMSADVETLALAYYFTENPRYAGRAASLLRTWFLDPKTRMNPNMNFGQAVPGRENGRAEGIIDTTRLQRVVDGIGLIGPSGMLTAAEQTGLEKWFGDYVDWMRSSPNGKAEAGAKNNHALWFDAQAAQFALFARRPEITRAVVDAFPKRRIAPQFTPEGKLPQELTRTRSLHYSIYALLAAYDVAEMGKCVGTDLWNYADPSGKSLRRTTDFLAGYRGNVANWPYQELRPGTGELDELLRRAKRAWPDGAYVATEPAELKRFMKAGGGAEGAER